MIRSFVILFSLVLAGNASAQPAGEYLADLKFLAKPDSRNVVVLEDFSYRDRFGVVWTTPKNTEVDGASIPQFAWSIVGGPLDGPYRHASVIHDYYCVTKDRDWKRVHRVFYEAMLTSNVELVRAKAMYAAVFHFGPRWKLRKKIDLRDERSRDRVITEAAIELGTPLRFLVVRIPVRSSSYDAAPLPYSTVEVPASALLTQHAYAVESPENAESRRKFEAMLSESQNVYVETPYVPPAIGDADKVARLKALVEAKDLSVEEIEDLEIDRL